MNSQEILVSVQLGAENIRVGTLWCHVRKGRESASFQYDDTWLSHPEKFALEPALQLTQGAFHTHNTLALFGAIGDSAPDRWGRMLMRRHHASHSTLFESDYLLGVNDLTRQGALRFSLPEATETYLASATQHAIPPLLELPKLLAASEHVIANEESTEDLKMLLAPGSSLGGARPKASIFDRHSALAIAKFPRKDDEYAVVIWEAIALKLASMAGIKTTQWRLEHILNKPVLVIQRFDRKAQHRIPFVSAMSMLGAVDNEQHSYLEIADAIRQFGAQPQQDLTELWRRIVFNIMIANTDDHLRNHGFLYHREQGWTLSPAYDLNPTPLSIKPKFLSTAIDLTETAADIDVALSVATQFNLNATQAKSIIAEIQQAVKQWPQIAKQYGLSQQECAFMASAFVH